MPWIAGVDALAWPANLDLTPEQFWAAGLKTGDSLHVRHDGEDVSFGPIAKPVALIERLQRAHR